MIRDSAALYLFLVIEGRLHGICPPLFTTYNVFREDLEEKWLLTKPNIITYVVGYILRRVEPQTLTPLGPLLHELKCFVSFSSSIH